MANYEYIIASLPDVTREWKFADGESQADFICWIKSQLTSKDIKTVDTLLAGGKEENLTKEFYQEALKDGNRFIREYFAFDLGFRNVKARFVNKVFGRPLSQDTIDINPGEEIDKNVISLLLQDGRERVRVVLPDGLSESDIKTTKNLSNNTLFSKF